jgi:hypothetical protein
MRNKVCCEGAVRGQEEAGEVLAWRVARLAAGWRQRRAGTQLGGGDGRHGPLCAAQPAVAWSWAIRD